MEVKYSFVCDCANIDTQGKLNVLGIFNNIYLREFPGVYGNFMYVAALEFSRSETGDHNFRLCFIDYDGSDVLPPQDGRIEVNNAKSIANIIIKIGNVQFPKEGIYRIDLALDGRLATSVLINLIKRAQNIQLTESQLVTASLPENIISHSPDVYDFLF